MAEELATEHMRRIGFSDARRAQPGPDKGLDVVASRAAAQVKSHASPVGAPDVQRLRGAAFSVDAAIFYSRSGYTQAGHAAALAAGIALFEFTEQNEVVAANEIAEQLASGSLMSQARKASLASARVYAYNMRANSWLAGSNVKMAEFREALAEWQELFGEVESVTLSDGPEKESALELQATIEPFLGCGSDAIEQVVVTIAALNARLEPLILQVPDVDVTSALGGALVDEILQFLDEAGDALDEMRTSVGAAYPPLLEAATTALPGLMSGEDRDEVIEQAVRDFNVQLSV